MPTPRLPRNRPPTLRELCAWLEYQDWSTCAPASDDTWHPYAWPPLRPDGEPYADAARTAARLQRRNLLGAQETCSEGMPCYRIALHADRDDTSQREVMRADYDV